MRSFFGEKRGITLIALVLTIVVLVLLSAISLAVAFGDNGILNKAIKSKKQSVIADVNEAAELIRGEYELDNLGKNPTSRFIIEKLIENGKITADQVIDYGDENQTGIIAIEGEQLHIYGSFSGAGQFNLPDNAIIAISDLYILRNNGDLSSYVAYNTNEIEEKYDSTKLQEQNVLSNVKTLNQYNYIVTNDGQVYNSALNNLNLSNVDRLLTAGYNEFIYIDTSNYANYYNSGSSYSLGALKTFNKVDSGVYIYTNNNNELYLLKSDGTITFISSNVASVSGCKTINSNYYNPIGFSFATTTGDNYYYFTGPNKLVSENNLKAFIRYSNNTYPYIYYLLIEEEGIVNLYNNNSKVLDNVTYMSKSNVNNYRVTSYIENLYIVSNNKVYSISLPSYSTPKCLSDNEDWSIYGKDIVRVDVLTYDFTSSRTYKNNAIVAIDSDGEVHMWGYAHSNVIPSKISDCLINKSVNLFDNQLKGSSINYRETTDSNTETISCLDWKDAWIKADGSHVKFKSFGLGTAEDVDGNFYEWNLMTTLDVSKSPYAVLGVSDGKVRKAEGTIEVNLQNKLYSSEEPNNVDLPIRDLSYAISDPSIVNPYATYWGLFYVSSFEEESASLSSDIYTSSLAVIVDEFNTTSYAYYFTKHQDGWYFGTTVADIIK